MITYYYRDLRGKKIQKVDAFRPGVWIHVESPTKDEIQTLAKVRKLDDDLLEDATDPYEVPRVEDWKGVTYAYTRVPISKNDRTTTTPLFVGIGKDFILTIAQGQLSLFDAFKKGKEDVFTTQKTKFVLQLFFVINEAYNQSLVTISKKVRSQSANIVRIKNKDIAQFVSFEETLNDFVTALVRIDTLLRNLLSGRFIDLFEEDEDLVEDLRLANTELLELSKSTLKTIENVRNAYSTLMTNELNYTIRVLTAITIVLAVPTMIASFYGMNVELPFSDDPRAFFYVGGAAALAAIGVIVVFFRRELL